MIVADRGIITLAYGASKYIEMAKTLARSLVLQSPHIPRAIVTDCQDDEELAQLFTHIIPYNPEYGSNVRQKLYLDQYSPYQNTLFIDSDCVVVRDIDFVFERFAGKQVGVVGRRLLKPGETDSFCDVDQILKQFQLDALPKFNGGIYYFEHGEISKAVFETARDILHRFKDLGFFEFRSDGPNEEPIVSVAMSIHHQTMLPDMDIMFVPLGRKGSLEIDTFTGRCWFRAIDGKTFSAAIVHFAGVWSEHPLYRRETLKLKRPSVQAKLQVNPAVYVLQYVLGVIKYSCWRMTHHGKALSKDILNKMSPSNN